jgi:hypothetical protein
MNYPNDSPPDRILYSPHKALDVGLEMGVIPERLFRVFFPIWRVQVEGRQRVPTDFEELEWFIERGLLEGGFNSIQKLARFFGLEEPFVRQLVDFLRSIGHITGEEGQLSLTRLGRDSVQARIRYQDQEMSAQLYFDGLGSRPLTQDHYKIPIYETLPEHTPFQAFYHFNHHWNEEALKDLAAHPERSRFNLPDEVTQVTPLGREPAYLPVYILHRQAGGTSALPEFLVFSRVRGLRDPVLEPAVNEEPLIQRALLTARRDDFPAAVESTLLRRGLSREAWRLTLAGKWGPQVIVDRNALQSQGDLGEDGSRGLAMRNVGRYLFAYDWCVWLTCDNAAVRQQAAVEQLLEWLQGANVSPTTEKIQQRQTELSDRLEIEPVSLGAVAEAARTRGLARALERLEPGLAQNSTNGPLPG